MHDLQSWEPFYLIVGGAAGALIGLQFVVMTLVADRPTTREGTEAFTTPTVAYFTTALLLSALASVPWRGMAPLAAAWAAVGAGGLAYAVTVARHMRRQDIYKPVFVDWLFNLALPALCYLALVAAGALGAADSGAAIETASAAALSLLLVAVRNSWDVISYHVTVGRSGAKGPRTDSLASENGDTHGVCSRTKEVK
jgi:hypothetical protein